MSKKFFSLIHGDQVHLAPNTKVIPSEALQTLATAEEVLAKVREDAEKYRNSTAEECERQKEQATQEGFEEGQRQWNEKLRELEEEILEVRNKLEKLVVPIALKAAKKIVGRELEISKDTVVDIVANSLKAVTTHKKVKICVSKEDLEALEKQRERLKKMFETLESFIIEERDDISPGGCLIETEGGIINATIENQWMMLENAFDALMKKQKTADMV